MLDLAFSTDTAPEIFQVSDFALSYEKGQMMDLTGYLTDEYMARFNDGSFFEGVNMYDGKNLFASLYRVRGQTVL